MAAGDLIDLATVKAWLGIPSGTTTSDAQLSGLITAASTFIQNYLDRTIAVAAYTETVQGNGQSFMLLRQAPVTAVSSLAWQGSPSLAAGDPITGTPGYYIDIGDDQARSVLRLYGCCFPRGQAVRVAYTAGYASPPADIAQACVELVGEAFRRRDHIGQTSKSLAGQESIQGFSQKDMNATIKAMLAPYQLMAPL